jgi:hypothetical protein
VRRTDFKQASARLGWQETADEDYWALMDEFLSVKPSLKFFLAGDCPATKDRFRTRFGSRICSHDVESFERSQSKAVRSALIDMVLLARTAVVCGAPYSTFSRVASLYGRFDFGCAVPAGARQNRAEIRRNTRALLAMAEAHAASPTSRTP